MSWARLLASGAGTIAWRLSIEGWPDDFVSHRGMEGPVLPRNVRTVAQALSLTTSSGNLLSSGAFAGAGGTPATVTPGATDPAGGTGAYTIADASAGAAARAETAATTYVSGHKLRGSLWVRKDLGATHFCEIRLEYSGGTSARVALRLDTGASAVNVGSFTSLSVIDLGAWWFVAFEHVGAVDTSIRLAVYAAFGTVSSFPSTSTSATGSTAVYGARIVDADAVARGRLVGLSSEGFKFSERVHLPTAKWEADGNRFTVADVDQRATELFSLTPTASTYLDADIDHTDTTINVLSTAGFADSGYLYLDSETIAYTGKTSTSFTGCTRGQFGSLATSHYLSFGARLRAPEITNWPVSIEGRRVRLYAYGAGDDKQGEGTRVWTGVVRTEASFDGLRWSFLADPLSSILDFKLGGDLEEPRGIRGIYYPWTAPLRLEIAEGAGAGLLILWLAGFWETQEAFCEALTTAIAAATPIFGSMTQGPYRAVPNGASWALQWTSPSTGELEVGASAISPIDGPGAGAASFGRPINVITGRAETVQPSTTYRLELTAGGLVPRAALVNGNYSPSFAGARHPEASATGVDPASNPSARIYLSGSAPSSAVTGVLADWPATPPATEAVAIAGDVTATDTTLNSITLDERSIPRGVHVVQGDAAIDLEIKMTRTIARGNLRAFLQALEDATTAYAVTGGVPFIRPTAGGNPSDFDLSDAGGGGVIDAAALAGGPLTTSRKYTLLAAVDLRELVEHECRLLGIYPCSNSAGQITFKRLELPVQTLDASNTLTASNILVDDGFLTLERSPHGTLNSVVYRLGYDPIEDESTASPVMVRDVASFGRNPQPRTLEIAPKSMDGLGRIIVDEHLVPLASRILGIFGGPHSELTVEVPLTFMGTALGSAVGITWSKIPSGRLDANARARGLLGVSGKVGLVVSREFEPMQAKGTLTILLTDQRIGGYAPGAKLLSITGTDGGAGPFTATLDAAAYFPSGTSAEDFFAAGYKIRLYLWNSTDDSLDTTGTVSSISGNDVTFTTDGGWVYTLGATWCLGYGVSTAISAAGQKRFVFLAGSDGDLDWSDSTDNPPFTFA